MILYCVRHGQSTYNAQNRIQGQSDVPLSPLGRRQSEALAQALAGAPIDAVYSSPLERALDTARAIAAAGSRPLCTDSRLKEVALGVFEGRLRRQLSEIYPEELARWASGDPDYAVPGGESRRDLQRRGMGALQNILRVGHREAAVIAHGRLLVVTLRGLLGAEADAVPSLLQNGSITTVESSPDGRLRLRAVDQVEHLLRAGLSGGGDL